MRIRPLTFLLLFPIRSPLLYVHTVLAFILFPVTIIFMQKFSVDLHFKDVSLILTRTLLIEKIPLNMSTNQMIRRHFDEAYPDLHVTEVNVAYDVAELIERTSELRDVRDSRELGEKYQLDHGGRSLSMYPKTCSRFCGFCCICCSEKVNIVSDKLYFLSKCSSRWT